MYHFFTDGQPDSEGRLQIGGGDVNHIQNVLRMKPGEKIKVSDGGSRMHVCSILEFLGDCVLCRILETEEAGTELPSQIYLFQGLPKGDKMELIIQKAVELGAAGIIPVAASRSVVKLDAKKEESKRRRWNGIAESAAKQSGRTRIPEVEPVLTFKEAVGRMQGLTHGLIPYELCEGMDASRQVFAKIRPGESVGIMIGPEGGFEKEEIAYALERGIVPVTLGRRILRTETAGMAVLSILMFLLEQGENGAAKQPAFMRK